MATFTPDTNPDVLQWARKVIGLPRHIAAERIGVKEDVLDQWEKGEVKPTLGQLRHAARVYRKPLATLLLAQLPKHESPIKADFRLLLENQGREWSTELHLALLRVQMQHDVAIQLARLDDNLPPPIELSLTIDDDVEVSSEIVRDWLEESAPRPVNSYGKRDFSQWITLIEVKTILVTQATGISLEEMRGCSISEEPFPTILLNANDSPNGRLFTLIHELAHILLHAGGICDQEDRFVEDSGEKERIERFCNALAAAVLIPRAQLFKDRRVVRAAPSTRWSEREIAEFSTRFGVSREALILRLVELKRASWDLYFELRPRYERAHEETKQDASGTGFFSPYQRKIRDFGRRYTISVLNAYHREDITGLDLANYLDMRLNHVPQLEERLGVRR